MKVLDSDPYLKQVGGWETCFGMFTLVKSDGLGGTRVGTSTFLARERYRVLHVTRGGRGAPKPTQLGLSEGIYVVGGGRVFMRTNP